MAQNTQLIDAWLRWSSISKFMRLKISQFASAIPVIGYLLVWSATIQHFLEAHPTLKKYELLSVVSRLKLIYLGSICLAIAWALYLSFCPRVIKRHQTEEEFLFEQATIDDRLTFDAIKELARGFTTKAGVNIEAVFTPVVAWLVSGAFRAQDLYDAVEYPNLSKSPILPAYYLNEELRHYRQLVACACFIGLGITLVAIPSIEVFVLVIWTFFFRLSEPKKGASNNRLIGILQERGLCIHTCALSSGTIVSH